MINLQHMIDEFLESADEVIDYLTADVMELEGNQDSALLNRIYRAFHSLKGDADTLGIEPVVRLAHEGENFLSLIRANKHGITKTTIDHILHHLDMMKISLSEIRENRLSFEKEKTPDPAGSNRVVCSGPESGNIKKEGADKKPLKILIVEDNFLSRLILMEFLSQYGVCHIAKDGVEAIEAFVTAHDRKPPEPYDLICLDILLPRMDGHQACKTIREIERGKEVEGTEDEAAIIMITALDDPATYVKACYECGADAFLRKPVDLNQLKRQLSGLRLIH